MQMEEVIYEIKSLTAILLAASLAVMDRKDPDEFVMPAIVPAWLDRGLGHVVTLFEERCDAAVNLAYWGQPDKPGTSDAEVSR